ncbi:MAG: metallophosphoesterase, partial [Telluria sp.]
MTKPFGVISDTHVHNWSAFATTLPNGVNSRLQAILDETTRCAAEVKAAGGNRMYHGGDLFHVRGSIAPSVLNPTMDCYREIIKSGVEIVINAGNHDLEGKEADRVGSAITALEGIGCRVVNGPNYGGFDEMVIIPWIPNLAKLKEAIEYVAPVDRPGCDLLLHAPIDGVIPGLPDHGLAAVYLAGLGYRRVFSGHYHHHKDLGGNVFSIGSLTAQTWSDVDKKSGFLIVTPAGVEWRASRAPSFVEIDDSTDPSEIPLIVDGNYVRVKINSNKASDV